MADYRLVVEEIQSFLNANDQTFREEMRDLADDYAELVNNSNERLRRCKEFLDQNLRSEAIQLAEAEPKVVDVVSVLDFEQFAEWEELCADHALTPPPKLLLLVAEDLNAAYAAEQPLKVHLKQLRYLALAKAPLDRRIAVMRQLAQLDPESHYWNEDLALFEQARHRELEDVAREAAARGDVDALKRLVKELQSDTWHQPPDEDLVNRVKRFSGKLSRRSGRERLEELLPALQEAHQTQDVDRARQLRPEWKQAAKHARLNHEDELVRSAQPVLDWLTALDQQVRQEAAWQKTIERLVTELNRDMDSTVKTLERLRHEAIATGYALPAEVEERFSKTVRRIQSAATRSRRLTIYGAGAGVLAVVGILAFIVHSGMRRDTIDETAEALQALINKGDLNGANELIAKLEKDSPDLLEKSKMKSVLDEIKKQREKDNDRAADFQRHISSTETYVEAGIVEKAKSELSSAEEIMQLSDERDKVAELKVKLNLLESDTSRQNDVSVAALVAQTITRLERVEELVKESDFSKASELIDQAATLISEAEEKSDGVSEDVAKQLSGAHTKLTAQRANLLNAQQANLAESAIVNAILEASTTSRVIDLDVIDNLMEKFTSKFSDSSRVAGFRRTRKAMPLAKAALKLSEAMRSPHFVEVVGISSIKASQQEEFFDDLVKDLPGTPDGFRIRAYHTFVGAAAKRDSTEESLRAILSGKLISGLTQIENREGMRWYSQSEFTADPDRKAKIADRAESADSILITYITDFNSTTSTDRVRTEGGVRVTVAPQSALSRKLIGKLSQGALAKDWEEAILSVMETIRLDKETDAVLRVIMLDAFLENAVKASPVLDEALSKHALTLKNSGIDKSALWMNPYRTPGNKERTKAETFLKDRLPPFTGLERSIETSRSRITVPLGPHYQLVGLLREDSEDGFQVTVSKGLESDSINASLFVISASGTATTGVWKKIGTISEGRIELLKPTAEFVDGSLVFAVRFQQ